MDDAFRAALWGCVLLGGLAVAGGLRRLGVARTHVRDVLHVGAGVWPLGWAAWHARLWPIAIPCLALLAMAAVPLLAGRVPWAARAMDAVSSKDESFTGLVLYTLSVAVLTAAGLLGQPFAAAAALLALALGDGLGGALGLAFGRHRFRLPWGKQKSLEGALGVAVFSTGGVLLAMAWFFVPAGLAVAALAGAVAAVAEAVSPRATDNVVVPACVFCLLLALQGGR